MSLSFQEKSLWLMLVSLIAALGFYFITVLPAAGVDVMPQQVVLFVLAIVLLVVMQIVGHAVIAIMDRRTGTDERDRLIGLKGTRNASYVLATGIFLALCAALWTEGDFLFTHLLLGFWGLAQLVEIGSQLVLYRRGA
jgi:4-hydroxybenzoate polyprenyltransferase